MSKLHKRAQAGPPVAPKSLRSITWPKGFYAAGGAFGIKPSGNPDMALIAAEKPCSAAGVFTQNLCPGAPVIVGKKHIRSGTAQAIIVNAGCANVMTGEQGLKDAFTMCQTVAEQLGCQPKHVLPASTGVIGHMLPMDKIQTGIQTLSKKIGTKQAQGLTADAAAANAILTTDLVPKTASKSIKVSDKAGGSNSQSTIRLAGIAKGSGMIQPNMATMLSFLTTDAAISPKLLKACLKQSIKQTFNRISVDHDTSTSDMVLILASGESGVEPIVEGSAAHAAFQQALDELCADLSYQIVQDGEGASKVYKVNITGAQSEQDADKVGYTVTGSPLVKTAVHGGDPNWGRLLAALGRSGAKVKPEQTSLWIGNVCLLKNGEPQTLTISQQKRLDQLMQQPEIVMTLDLGFDVNQDEQNPSQPTVQWLGCDLSREYITINADYTT